MRVVGQPPRLVDLFDDKGYTNNLLRKHTDLPLPRAWTVRAGDGGLPPDLPFPVVAKPVRGRGSHGVRVCRSEPDLWEHLSMLLGESPVAMLEEFLAGEEATVAVLPPGPPAASEQPCPPPVALALVTRFDHEHGIAPYSGVRAVKENSGAVPRQESERVDAYRLVREQCVQVARLLNVIAPIRIDVRRFTNDASSPFAIFDVNMKPVRRQLREVLSTARPLDELRSIEPGID